MKPIEFTGQTIIIAKDQREYLPLPAKELPGPNGEIITCWELTDEDIATIVKTRKLWISMFTFGKAVTPIRPYIEDDGPVETIQFRTPNELIEQKAVEKCAEAYEFTRESLEIDYKSDLLHTVQRLIKEDGIQDTWKYFKFAQKLPEQIETLKMTFEYMDYMNFMA